MQDHIKNFADAGIAVYALSYDEPDALADYASGHGVTFPLLSDPNSEIIERFGILNTLTDPDDHPWYGIPFPGSYVVDEGGTIIDKFFESSFMLRPSADQLLRAALGEAVEQPRAERTAGASEDVTFDVSFDGQMLNAGVVRDLVVKLNVPQGFHLYGEPVPDGMVATSVEIDDQVGLVVNAPRLPPTSPLTLAGTGETLQVFDGDVEIRIPIAHMTRGVTEDDAGNLVIAVTGTIRWQSCDVHTCQLPRHEPFALSIPAARHNSPRGKDANFSEHFAKMSSRRLPANE